MGAVRLIGLAVLLIGCRSSDGPAPEPPPLPEAPRDPYSNIRAADYVGPDACGECHEEKHAAWQTSLHAAMNQRAEDGARILGDFDGARLEYAGNTAIFDRDAEGPTMIVGATRYRITRTIGSRYLQEYVGRAENADGPEVRLPFGWWVRAARWVPQPYFDSWFEDEYTTAGEVAFDPFVPDSTPWATRCAWCHNTYPFELRVTRHDGEDATGQGPERHVSWRDDAPRPAGAAAILRDNLLPLEQLVTVGISCESCHLGGREHAADEDVLPRFAPSSPDLVRSPDAPDPQTARANPAATTAVCAQCHSTPSPRFPGGAAVRNSSEALDLRASACAPEATCIDCHDPHVAGPGPGAPSQPDHEAACTGCHDGFATREHSRHDDVGCLDCHMPKIVQGISAFVRTHRISKPVEPAMLEIDAPNACNLCHLDRSIAWTLEALATGWGVDLPYTSASDPTTPAGESWLASDARTVRIIAAAAYARSPDRRAAMPRLVGSLDDARAFYRMFMLFAVEDALGRRLRRDEYDPLAPPATRAEQVERLRLRSR